MSLRCAVVGTGAVALNSYLPYLVEQEGIELAYLSRSNAKSVHAQSLFGGTVLADVEELASWAPDVAFILTTDTQHAAVMGELLARGVARIFVEKPLVAARGQAHVEESDFWHAAELVRVAEQHGAELAVGFNYRFFETVKRAIHFSETSNFGRLIGVVGDAHYACWSHTLDLIGLFAGPFASLVALSGDAAHGEGEMQGADRVIAFTSVGGAAGTLRGSAGRPWNGSLLSIVLQYEHGRLELDDLDVSLRIFDAAQNRAEMMTLGADVSRWSRYDASFEASLGAYLDSVRRRTAPPVSGWDGVRELQVEAAIARAIAEHRRIDVQAEFPLT